MQDKNVKVASYLGLAQRAGAVIYGEDMLSENLRKLKLVLIDSGAPEKYKSRVTRRLAGVQTFEFENLNVAIHRDRVNAVGVTNTELAKAITEILR